MPRYRLAAQDFHFAHPIAELESFETAREADGESVLFTMDSLDEKTPIARAEGWVGGAQRIVETYDTPRGILLKVEGGGAFFINRGGEIIGAQNPNQLDREIILGPALVLALAQRGVWSLHASAATYKENCFAFLGESGQGKSTLAAYLSQSAGWRLVADDILPIEMESKTVNALPHFPQLKLPPNAQPGADLPERIPLKYVCALADVEANHAPELQILPTAQAVQVLLGHTAGTRMFNAAALAKHLEFSTQAAKQISARRLNYPHRRDALPLIKDFLETLC
ncbi:MAG: hypothetical protein PHQ36_03470 [Anaerolineales bacterium]|nr:hypothetical protein [Anaerolineales bacterium]